MSARDDLTRWNRASLSRFRYIGGNAVTFLEALRQALIERFADHDAQSLQWESLVPRQQSDPPDEDAYARLLREQERIQNETERERLDRIGAQYNGERRDWGWEIARVLARSAHVLTEHIDAYANEGFLRTATQWDNVRRLVEMLDYHPAPPASAATLLVIEAKPDARGTLEAGFQVKYAPPEGGAPVVFETLADVDIDVDLNQLRPAEYNRNQYQLEGNRLALEREVEGLEIGQPLVLEDEKTGDLHGHRIQGLQVEDGATMIRVSPPVSYPLLKKGYAKVHLQAKDRLQPLGPAAQMVSVGRVLHLTSEPQGLEPKTEVVIADGDRTYYRRVASVHGKLLELGSDLGPLRLDEAWVGLPVTIEVNRLTRLPDDLEHIELYKVKTAGDWSYLAGQRVAKPVGSLPVYTVNKATYQPVADGTSADEGFTILIIAWNQNEHNVSLENTSHLLVPPAVAGPWQVDTYLEREKRPPEGHPDRQCA